MRAARLEISRKCASGAFAVAISASRRAPSRLARRNSSALLARTRPAEWTIYGGAVDQFGQGAVIAQMTGDGMGFDGIERRPFTAGAHQRADLPPPRLRPGRRPGAGPESRSPRSGPRPGGSCLCRNRRRLGELAGLVLGLGLGAAELAGGGPWAGRGQARAPPRSPGPWRMRSVPATWPRRVSRVSGSRLRHCTSTTTVSSPAPGTEKTGHNRRCAARRTPPRPSIPGPAARRCGPLTMIRSFARPVRTISPSRW